MNYKQALPLPTLHLGTAMWGWTTTKKTAFSLLDEWYRQGFREVDAATNYPIDKNPEHFRLAEKILLEWIKVNGISDLQVMMKIGSVNNLRSPEHILTKSFVLLMLDEYKHLFGSNLETFMIHWDNRDNQMEIRETLEAFVLVKKEGLQVGLSGIRHPDIYADLNQDFGLDFKIQIKHNILHSDYGRYALFHGRPRFITYGINAGGLKLDSSKYAADSSLKARGTDLSKELVDMEKIKAVIYSANEKKERPPLTAFHQVGMTNAFYQPDILGILLGASKVEQLKESIAFYELLKDIDYSDVYGKLITISK